MGYCLSKFKSSVGNTTYADSQASLKYTVDNLITPKFIMFSK